MTVFTPLVLYAYKEYPQSLGRFGGLGVARGLQGKGPPLGSGGFSGICGVFGASTASCVLRLWASLLVFRVKKRDFKSFLIVRGCFWVRVPPLAGSRFWQFFGFRIHFCFLENFKMDNLGFQRVPGQDLPENGSFAFVQHKEFISRIPSIILLHFGFPQRIHVPFQASGSWKTRFSS